MKFKYHIISIAIVTIFSYSCNNGKDIISKSNHNQMGKEPIKHKFTNSLINETSPYLLQHAHNPVNWYPWGDEALEKAKNENKVLLISIGYAACHWCHVMEHESFEDEEIAAIMNERFVCIKVDREERPDIDQIYMNAVQLMTRSGGWPLNCFALPDGRPFYGGTYFQKDKWKEILLAIHQAYTNDYNKVLEYAENLSKGINESEIIKVKNENKDFKIDELTGGYDKWSKYFDTQNGGNMKSPKFPLPNSYQFLLRYFFHTNDNSVLQQINLTLDKMLMGGIYDQIGGGFSRYSVDEIWKVPHFEKMLYDNGQLVSLYSEAYQLTKNEQYKSVVEETLEFITRELTSEEYGFYSSLDADSEGEEGKFYVWTANEIESVLNKNEAELIKDLYSIEENGNWEHQNILFIQQSEKELLKKHGLSAKEFDAFVIKSKEKLLNERAKRIRPGLDDKILTSWNALMLNGLVDAYKAFGNEKYIDLALKNADFIEKRLIKSDYRLDRNYKNGKSSINGFLDDYALTANAFISLYQVSFDEHWLELAKNLTEYCIKHFYDANSGMFYYTSDIDKSLVARKMELSDNVIPASNSTMANVLFKLSKFYFVDDYKKKSIQMISNMKTDVLNNLPYYSNWGILMLNLIYEPFEIAIIGEDSKKIIVDFYSNFTPNILFAATINDSKLEIFENRFVKGETLIYVCKENVCKMPVKTVEEALLQMKN